MSGMQIIAVHPSVPLTVDVPVFHQTGVQYRHFLNLGAGVQSTTLALMFDRGEIVDPDGSPIRLSAAIFADTQEEPGAVYRHLDWLIKTIKSYPILVRSKSKMGDDLLRGENATGQRFASIPAYTKAEGDVREGQVRRQCSQEYKVRVIEQTIRRDGLGLQPKRRVPPGISVIQYIGFSLDEAGRANRLVAGNLKRKLAGLKHRPNGCAGGVNGQQILNRFMAWSYRFPLVENGWTRTDCQNYLPGLVPHKTPRSACVFCPYHDDLEWYLLKVTDPEGWQRAVEIDEGLRRPGVIVNRGVEKSMYLHRSCTPLVQVELNPDTMPKYVKPMMTGECDGVCGV
jgi:hypothetical protein